jgi:predicted RNase H-like nuclease
MDSLVLGIDASWTPRNPSGIALLAVAAGHKLELLRVARACAEFTFGREIGPRDWLNTPPSGETLNVTEILDAAIRHAGALPNVIALDIPLSPLPIRGRRPADNAISSKYGSRWAGAHTPSAECPGPVSAALFQQLSSSGYYWVNATERVQLNGQIRYFLETYPHPVIVEMLGLERRLCYKVAKRQKYWPSLTPDKRWRNVASELDRLHSALASRIGGFADRVPKACDILDAAPKSKGVVFKGIEDVLDSVVCALVGCEFLAGHALPLGDRYSAIWVPRHG